MGHVTESCIVVSDCMLISILSLLVEPLEMLCAEAADALAPRAGDFKGEDLLSLWSLMCVSLETSIFLLLLPFLGPIFLFKSNFCTKQKPINKLS